MSPDVSRRGLLKWVRPSVRPSEIPSVRRHNEKGSLWAQLLLQFNTDLFEILKVFLSWSEDVHVIMGLSSHYFLSTFSTFFPGAITIGIDTLWTQLLLAFSTDHHFFYIVWRYACGFRVILLLFFIDFFHFFDLVFLGQFSSRIDLVGTTPPRLFHWSFGNYAYLFYMVWRQWYACSFVVIRLLFFFFQLFALFQYSFWPGLGLACQAVGHSSHTNISTLPKHLRR